MNISIISIHSYISIDVIVRRIFDIIPKKVQRNLKEKKTAEVLSLEKEEKKIEKPKGERRKIKPTLPLRSKKILIPIFVIAFLGGVWSYFALPNAKITVWPKINNIEQKVNLVVNTAVKETNFSEKILAGQLIEAKKEISQEFQSSGKQTVENKARGVIRIYNNYSTSSQVLVATTRFISDSGRLFRLKERVVVPAATIGKGKLVASYIDAEVIADKAGEDYNIGPSVFSIPGFAGTPKFTGFYGKSFTSMTGGFIGEKPQITKEDMDNASKSLTEQVLKEVKQNLVNQIPPGFVLADGASSEKILNVDNSAKVGDNLSSFTVKINAVSQGIIFKKSDIENLVRDYLNAYIQKEPALAAGNKKIQEGSLKINYYVDRLDLAKGKLFLNPVIKAMVFSDLNLDLFKTDLRGMGQKEISDFFNNQPEIDRVEVKLWPFWVRKIPNNVEKIKMGLDIDPVRN